MPGTRGSTTGPPVCAGGGASPHHRAGCRGNAGPQSCRAAHGAQPQPTPQVCALSQLVLYSLSTLISVLWGFQSLRAMSFARPEVSCLRNRCGFRLSAACYPEVCVDMHLSGGCWRLDVPACVMPRRKLPTRIAFMNENGLIRFRFCKFAGIGE